ncbi:MAG: hypothetical protein DWI24_09475 [Planctomycetota bacterium]|nr:MAG: hypothetical protein DWI24_09475 [Planctomycetota bacterium]
MLYGNLPIYSNNAIPTSASKTLNFAAAYQYTLSDGTVLPAQFPAPTIKLKQGDTLSLKISNSLGDPNTAPMPPIEALPTNFHTHGLLVSPLGNGDNVYRAMNPDGTYQTTINVPDYQPSGVDWYHVHKHGYSADQVYAGLAGVMQIGDPLDAWPQYLGKYDEKILSLSLGLKITGMNASGNPVPGSLMLAKPNQTNAETSYGKNWQVFVNGQFNPTMTMQPGETQIWTLAATTRNGSFNFGITDENGQNPWQSTILGYDGNDQDSIPRVYTQVLPTGYVKNGLMALDSGGRLTVAVTAPTTPDTYYLVNNLLIQQIPTTGKPNALMTIVVAGATSPKPVPVFGPNGVVPDLYTAIADQKRTFNFNIEPGNRFTINGYTFPNGPIVSIQAGEVEEWLLTNTSANDHPFHIHQTDFAVISINGQKVDVNGKGTYPYVSMRDTINIPAGGNVVIRFRVNPIPGKFVFHCHILPHEDQGMMMSVIAGPNADELREALGAGPGEGGGVLVQGGYGQLLGRLNPLPKNWQGGVATATGNLNADMVQEIVAGPASRGTKSTVTIYNGKDLSVIKKFNPFPEYPASGVSLAIGDIDHDGVGEIIVGRVGPGPSLVRIFHADGSLYLQLKGTLPGNYPNGVNVASADFNGDNYDDLAIGAGKGEKPIVVGLDGFSLGLPEGAIEVKLFDFIAPGGGRSGVNLGAGYFDPSTVPSYLANLITTPPSGPKNGNVSVWNVQPSLAGMGNSMAGMAGMSGDPVSNQAQLPPPGLMATLTPFGKQRTPRGLQLTTTRLSKDGIAAVGAWWSAHNPVYQSISLSGLVSTISTPTPRGPVVKSLKSSKGLK